MATDQAGDYRATGAADRPRALMFAALLTLAALSATDRTTPLACHGPAIEYDVTRAEVRDAVAAYQQCLAADARPERVRRGIHGTGLRTGPL